MKNTFKVITIIGVLTLLTMIGLTGIQSYFHNKEIQLATDLCYENGGIPEVDKDFLALNYSFSCEISR